MRKEEQRLSELLQVSGFSPIIVRVTQAKVSRVNPPRVACVDQRDSLSNLSVDRASNGECADDARSAVLVRRAQLKKSCVFRSKDTDQRRMEEDSTLDNR